MLVVETTAKIRRSGTEGLQTLPWREVDSSTGGQLMLREAEALAKQAGLADRISGISVTTFRLFAGSELSLGTVLASAISES